MNNLFKKIVFLAFYTIIPANISCMEEDPKAIGEGQTVQQALIKALNDKNLEKFKLLFEKHKVNPNAPLKDGTLPVTYAANAGSVSIFRYLAEEKKASITLPSQINNYKHSPLWMAASRGHTNIVQYLIEQRKHEVMNEFNSALCIAATKGKTAVVKYLITQPEYKKAINGPIVLRYAIENNEQNLIDLLKEDGVPFSPKGEAPKFFFNEQANKLFDPSTLEVIAFTQLPHTSLDTNPVNIYQIKVAQQQDTTEECIKQQLEEAALKLGGKPEDHKGANPIFGGSCGYHATKNVLLGLLILADYDQLTVGLEANNENQKQRALSHLKKDIRILTSFKPGKDFNSQEFMEKIHAKTYRVKGQQQKIGRSFEPCNIQQGTHCERQYLFKNKTESHLEKLLSKRFGLLDSQTQLTFLTEQVIKIFHLKIFQMGIKILNW